MSVLSKIYTLIIIIIIISVVVVVAVLVVINLLILLSLLCITGAVAIFKIKPIFARHRNFSVLYLAPFITNVTEVQFGKPFGIS
jgi:hypothetical protein